MHIRSPGLDPTLEKSGYQIIQPEVWKHPNNLLFVAIIFVSVWRPRSYAETGVPIHWYNWEMKQDTKLIEPKYLIWKYALTSFIFIL